MAKINWLIKGITTRGNRWGTDTIITDPPVPSNKKDVPDGTIITIKSEQRYMGIPSKTCFAIAKAVNGGEIIKITTPNGSYIEGEMELVEAKGMEINYMCKSKEFIGTTFRRRVVK